ncbi:MAG: hypothetical protein KDD55_13730, partial [Bdellovibrionales bacterium]|nr:hypothetical protein [Bdellovibrionales bacterium]
LGFRLSFSLINHGERGEQGGFHGGGYTISSFLILLLFILFFILLLHLHMHWIHSPHQIKKSMKVY